MGEIAKILDSGNRREFKSGALRDADDSKGRCDLLPLRDIAEVFFPDEPEMSLMLDCINAFVVGGCTEEIRTAIRTFSEKIHESESDSVLELSIHFAEGAKKYAERNWEKGIPCHCYIDSGVRHLLKWYRGDKDERHDRAFLWNMVCLLWTVHNRPECNDLPFATKEVDDG